MKQFKIYVENRPGELVKISEALGRRGINIMAIASEAIHSKPFVKIVTSDVESTRKALNVEGFKYELKEIVPVEMTDKPGELSKVAKRLARAKVNVESIYLLGQKNGMTQVALVVDDVEAAREALKL